jgi:MoxR-like ATPase/Mg-chelatase subunit ChlD
MASEPLSEKHWDFIFNQVTQKVVGRRPEIGLVLAAIAKSKPVLLFGLPGVSKTTILKEISTFMGDGRTPALFSVTGDEQLTAFSLSGAFDPSLVLQDGYKEAYFTEGPLVKAMRTGGILYIEELNRAPSGALNVLVTALSDGYLDIPKLGRVYARPGFTVVGACNPLDDVGTGRLSRGLLDRFVVINLDYQPRDEELEIVRRKTRGDLINLIPYAVDIARTSRSHPDLRHGASVRGAIDFVHLVEGYGPSKLDHDSLYFLGCSAYGSKVHLKPTVTRTACEVIKEIMANLLAENFGGNLDELKKTQAPWGEPAAKDETFGERDAGPFEEGGQQQSQEKDAETRKIPGIARPGNSGYKGKSASIPFLNRDLNLGPSDSQVKALREKRAEPMYPVDEIRRRAAHLVLRRESQVRERAGMRAGNFLTSEAWTLIGGGELDVDTTLHSYVQQAGKISPDDVYLYARAPEKRNYAIFVDHSGSMVGEKLLTAALLASVLAQLTYQRQGDYAVIAFDDELSQLKGLDEQQPVETVITELLRLPEGRSTDLGQVFRKALELSANGTPTDCIVISDLMPTKGLTTFAALKKLVTPIPSLYLCYMEEQEAAIELFAGKEAPNLVGFKLYRWWGQRLVGEERFHEINHIDDLEGLIRKLSGYGTADLL